MTRYYIHIPASIQTVDVMGDIVVRTTIPYIGQNVLWAPLRGYFNNHGYTIEPEITDQPHYILHKGITYEFEWRGKHHARILRHDEDVVEEIHYSELPVAVQNLL